MDELIWYLVLAAIVVAIVIAVITAIVSIGVFLLAGIAAVGVASGFVVGTRNFYEVLKEAHKSVPQ